MPLPLRTLTAGGSSMCTPRGFQHLGRSRSTTENLTTRRVFPRVCGCRIPPLSDARKDRICLLDSVYDILCCTISTIIVSWLPSTSDWQCSRRMFLLASIAAGKHAVKNLQLSMSQCRPHSEGVKYLRTSKSPRTVVILHLSN